MTFADRRILLVHAHPDDESINNGVTMARYVAEGAQVTLVTCTLGEMGEVLVPELAYLAADQDDQLGQHRASELDEAMAVLGVTDHRLLGGAGRFRDSGMKWDEKGHATAADEIHDNAFWHADLTEAALPLVEIIREIRPQVLVTYDDFGNYGHPDHVQAHRVAHYAADLAAARSFRPDLGEAWDIAKIYWMAMSASRFREGLQALRDAGDTTTFEGMEPDNLPPFAIEDEYLDALIESPDHIQAKLAAMKAHRTQITEDGAFFAGGMDMAAVVWGQEFYRLVKGVRGPVGDSGYEEDLFAGI
ncbi:N-acetyl-1-D-myo-inositol-2-amino-2-deoxy-alpha-D-glucopyranoside deacetylase [Aeromicrobium sp. P5_D10]